MRAARRDTTRTRTVGCAHVGSSRRACPRARVDERRVRASGRGAAAASATPRAATGGQHRGINVSRQARKQLLVGSSTATYARALARSLSSIASPSTGRQGPSLFLYCALTLSDNHTRRPQTPPPPAAHYHSSSRFRSFLLSSSLTLWLTGSLTQGRSKDGIEIDLTGQSSDTQRLVLKAALITSTARDLRRWLY